MTPERLQSIRSEARAKGYVLVETVEELVDEIERINGWDVVRKFREAGERIFGAPAGGTPPGGEA